MPVGVIMTFTGATIEEYDQVIAKMGFEPGGPGAPGGLSHWAAATDDGLMICDCWQSAELFEQFAAEKIGPITAEIGIAAPSEVKVYPANNHLTAGPTA